MGEDISESLADGDLKTILDALEAGRFGLNIVQDFFSCHDEPIGPEDKKRIEDMASIFNIEGGEALSRVEEADDLISGLINKGELLNILEDSTSNLA